MPRGLPQLIKWTLLLLSCVSVFLTSTSLCAKTDPAALNYQNDIRPLFEEYCYRCHGEEKQKGDIQLSSFHTKRMLLKEHKLWQDVLLMVREEEMPDEEPLPSPEDRALLVNWLEQTLNEIDWSKVKNPGHVTMPRLTKTEYNNTMRDLLGFDFNPGNFFSEDGEGQSGFTNDRDSLFITPVQMEKYFDAAERSIDALLSFKKEPIEYHFESEDMFMTETRETPKRFGEDFLGYVINRGQMTLYESIDFPHGGFYKFTIRALSTEGPTGTRLRINDETKGDIYIYSEEPGQYEITAFVPKGSHQVAWNIQKPAVLYKPKPQPEQPTHKEFPDKKVVTHKPQSVAIDWVNIRGPIRPADAPTEPLVFISQPGKGVSAKKAAGVILQSFTERAFRRNVSRREVARYRYLYEASAASGESFDDSVKLALTAVLVSPHFLYRPELAPSNTKKEYRIDDYQLAARLSYFLWMSMPDEELFQLAKSKRLHKRKTLQQQVNRMLKDPRATKAMETFLGQWLGFESLGVSVIPDPKTFKAFTTPLMEAMKAETFLMFDSLIKGGGSLLQLLDSDETFLNDVLAIHYGIDGVGGSDMRRMKLTDRRRGGLLGMGSILTATSNPVRTNPVSRGKWVLETLLGGRIPEPPADAGILPENAGQVKGQTLREEFEMHRRNPSCVDCHEKIDPIGFGLENFDAIGRFRTQENGKTIDSSGIMPDGVSFNGPVELKDYLFAEKQDSFIRNLTERMLAFALGRELQHYDEAALIKIIEALKNDNYSAKTLISEVVLSYPFQFQHPNPDDE